MLTGLNVKEEKVMKRFLSFVLVLIILSSVVLVSCNHTSVCDHNDLSKIIILESIAPSCTESGLTQGQKCSVCDTVIVDQVVIPTLSHTFGEWILVEDDTSSYFGNEIKECGVCGKIEIKTPSNQLSDAQFDPNEQVTITFYHTMGAELKEVLNKYIKEFEALYPNIKIVHSQEGGYDDLRDKIKTQLIAGRQPNMAFCFPYHVATYQSVGQVIPLDQLINHKEYGLSEEQKDDIVEAFYDEGRKFGDGITYTLPMAKSTEVLYYNKTFFEENNLSVPTTWDEMEALCEQILEIDPNCIPLGYDYEYNWFITMCEQLGSNYTSTEAGNHILFDNATNKAFVKRLAEWYKKGYVTTTEILCAYTSDIFVNYDYGMEKCYMSISSSAAALYYIPQMVDGKYPFEVGIASIPQVDPNNSKVICSGPSLVMFDSGNTQENIATWLFMKYLVTNTQFQAEYAIASKYMPVLKSAANDPLYADFLASADGGDNIVALSAKICLEQSDSYFTPSAFKGSGDVRDVVGEFLVEALRAIKTTPDAQWDAYIDQLFARYVAFCKNVIDE